MERILTKEEISELLSAVKHGDLPTDFGAEDESEADSSGGGGATKLNLVRMPGAACWKIPNLDIVMDSFAHNMSASLTSRLQRSVNVKSDGIEYLPFEEVMTKMTPCGAIGVLDLDHLKAGGLLIVDEKLPFVILEMQLGGGGADVRVVEMNRALTTIETNLLKIIMSDSCIDLKKALSPIEEIMVSLVKIENNPRLVNIVTHDAGTVLARFSVTIDDVTGMVALVIPHISLEPFCERLRDTAISFMPQRICSWHDVLQQGVCGLRTTVSGQVAEISLCLRDLLNFQVGDVIELGCSYNSQVKLLVEGQHKFNGQVGVREGRKAVRISEIIFRGVDDGNN